MAEIEGRIGWGFWVEKLGSTKIVHPSLKNVRPDLGHNDGVGNLEAL